MRKFLATISLVILLAFSARAEDSTTRWRLRMHVFYDAGLKIEDAKDSFPSKALCDQAGDQEEVRFWRRHLRASSLCLPIHFVSGRGTFI